MHLQYSVMSVIMDMHGPTLIRHASLVQLKDVHNVLVLMISINVRKLINVLLAKRAKLLILVMVLVRLALYPIVWFAQSMELHKDAQNVMMDTTMISKEQVKNVYHALEIANNVHTILKTTLSNWLKPHLISTKKLSILKF
jgi:nitrate reductase beta subunit